jgi:hypothetical protein
MKLCFALPVVLLIASTQSSLLAQSSDCTGKAAQAQLSSTDPVYVDAMDLARNLIDHGFIVSCVQASKWGNLFAGQEGAALYRTDQGDFDLLFLPKGESFDAVQVVEQRQGNLYLYSFRGSPHSSGRLEGKQTDFIRSGNLLFLVWSDAGNGYGTIHDLAASIEATLSLSPNPSGSCPVTKPPLMAFIPPSPYPTEQPADSFWFGTENLWTNLLMDGIWKGLPVWSAAEQAENEEDDSHRPIEPAFRNKLFWWHEGYDWRTDDPPNLTVTGKRLDAPAPPLRTDGHANNGWTTDSHHPFMVDGIFLPTLGCWQITGDYKGDRLSFVVLVRE